jgi:hypothetical protein
MLNFVGYDWTVTVTVGERSYTVGSWPDRWEAEFFDVKATAVAKEQPEIFEQCASTDELRRSLKRAKIGRLSGTKWDEKIAAAKEWIWTEKDQPTVRREKDQPTVRREKRTARTFAYNGEALTVRQWAERFGLPRKFIHCRLQLGWTVGEALTVPKGGQGVKQRKQPKPAKPKPRKAQPGAWLHVPLTYRGKTQTLLEWAKKKGIKAFVLHERVKWGWPVKKIMTTPVDPAWVMPAEEPKPSPKARRLTHQGETLALKQWAERIGIGYLTIKGRVARGWPVERILEAPLRTRKTITHQGKTLTIRQWAKETGIAYNLLRDRQLKGWPVERLFQPKECEMKLTYRGISQTVKAWAADVGVPAQILWQRLRRGWDVERTLTTAIPAKAHYASA